MLSLSVHQSQHVTLLFKEHQWFPIIYRIKPLAKVLNMYRLFTVCLQIPFQPPAPPRRIFPQMQHPSTSLQAFLSVWKVLPNYLCLTVTSDISRYGLSAHFSESFLEPF